MAYVYKDDRGSNKATVDALNQFSKDIKVGIEIEQEINRVWDKIQTDAFIACPKDTWSLANTIKVVNSPLTSMTGNISPIKSITIFNKTIVAGDLIKINPKTKRPVDYASLVHDGYVRADGKVVNGTPFLTESLAQNEGELNDAIERALAKLGKKFSRGNA